MDGPAISIRPAAAEDFPAVLALNAAWQHFLSPLSPDRLASLHAQACYHRVVAGPGGVQAFLLAFAEGADYDSPNYLWFAARYPRFLYIDRVVIAGASQGQGLGQRLYRDLFAFARDAGYPCVTCEYDLDPPNLASTRFHARFGFREVGRQQYGPLRKTVSLQCAAP